MRRAAAGFSLVNRACRKAPWESIQALDAETCDVLNPDEALVEQNSLSQKAKTLETKFAKKYCSAAKAAGELPETLAGIDL